MIVPIWQMKKLGPKESNFPKVVQLDRDKAAIQIPLVWLQNGFNHHRPHT